MIKKLKKFFESKDRKTVLKNFFSLSILQGLNLLLPFITFRHLIKVLGMDNFGLIQFSLVFVTYFQILTDYGFNMNATKEVSLHRDNPKALHRIFSEVFYTKLLLMCISVIIMSLIVFNVPLFKKDALVHFISFAGYVVGMGIFPMWFFQGLQKMKYITYINIICKTLFTVAILVFVDRPDETWLASLFTACGFLTAGVISLFFVYRQFQVKMHKPSYSAIKTQIIIGRYLFFSELKISLFTNTNTFIMGLFLGKTAVGYFMAAEKICRALGHLATPLSNAMFPYMSLKMTESFEAGYAEVNKVVKVGVLVFVLMLVPLYILAPWIIHVCYDLEATSPAVLLFRILLILPVTTFIDSMYGKQVLITLNKDNLYFKVILFAALLNVSLNVSSLMSGYGTTGTAVSIFITQLFIDAGMFYYAHKTIKGLRRQNLSAI